MAAWLVQLLKDEWGIVSGHHEEESGEETIEAASTFEAGQQNDLTQRNLHLQAARELYQGMTGK